MGLMDIFKKEKKGSKKAKKQPKPEKKIEKKPDKKPKKEEKISEEIFEKEDWPIRAIAIVEILGAPKEHVLETMNLYIEKMRAEKNLKIAAVQLSDIAEKEKLFTVFAEIELLAKRPSRIVDYCFDYMPSSIEILDPDKITFTCHEFSNFFNDLQARLHKLDMLVKNMTAEKKILSDNAHFLLRNNILLSLKEKDKDLALISRNIGIEAEKTKAFLDALVEKGIILLKKNKYSLNKDKVKFSE